MSDDDENVRLYAVKEVSRLFDVQDARLRYWAQTGFVGPSRKKGGRAYYTFQDLISVKAARDLLDGGISLQKVRKLLDGLRTTLPAVTHPLGQLRVCATGDELVVVEDGAAWEPTSGQMVLSFTVASLTREIAEVLELGRPAPAPAPVVREPSSPLVVASAPEPTAEPDVPPLLPPRSDAPNPSAYAAFLDGLRAEQDGDRATAEACYRRALAKDDGFSAAWTNLGNVLEATGERKAARTAYDRALGLDPDQPEARYNLANLLADDGDLELALAEYGRVIAQCPDFADAHFNAALVAEKLGNVEELRVRVARYLELDPDSPWADEARRLAAEHAPADAVEAVAAQETEPARLPKQITLSFT